MNRKTSVAKRVGNPPIKTSPHPPIKLEDYDSEDEYENAHAALDTRDELNVSHLINFMDVAYCSCISGTRCPVTRLMY